MAKVKKAFFCKNCGFEAPKSVSYTHLTLPTIA